MEPKPLLTLISLFVLVLIPRAASSQERVNPQWQNEAQLGQPVFSLQTYRRLIEQSDSVRLDVAVEVMNDVLQFVRRDSIYQAKIELLLSVTEDHGRQIAREVKAVSFKVRDYALTNARHQYQVSSFNTLLPPGHYHLTVVLTDQESRLRESVNREILAAKSNPQRLDLSDIMPAWSAEINELTGLPQDLTISGRPGENISSLFLHFDLMRPDPSLPCTLQAWVGREHQPDSCLNQMVLMDSANPAHSYMTIDLNPLDFGKYQARIAALAGGKRVERQTSFEINPHSLPGSIRNLDEALQQLSLIASRKEIDELRSLPPDIQEKRFIEFWNANFPTPGEGVNGKMVEYYNRIAYTNQMFGGSRPGWNTDRGHVHIIYGQPDEIEKQSFENQGMPYEIWYYNRLGKRFIFRDEYGFGDYRLVTPLW